MENVKITDFLIVTSFWFYFFGALINVANHFVNQETVWYIIGSVSILIGIIMNLSVCIYKSFKEDSKHENH